MEKIVYINVDITVILFNSLQSNDNLLFYFLKLIYLFNKKIFNIRINKIINKQTKIRSYKKYVQFKRKTMTLLWFKLLWTMIMKKVSMRNKIWWKYMKRTTKTSLMSLWIFHSFDKNKQKKKWLNRVSLLFDAIIHIHIHIHER